MISRDCSDRTRDHLVIILLFLYLSIYHLYSLWTYLNYYLSNWNKILICGVSITPQINICLRMVRICIWELNICRNFLCKSGYSTTLLYLIRLWDYFVAGVRGTISVEKHCCRCSSSFSVLSSRLQNLFTPVLCISMLTLFLNFIYFARAYIVVIYLRSATLKITTFDTFYFLWYVCFVCEPVLLQGTIMFLIFWFTNSLNRYAHS
jgi:hypothetical protein